MERTGEEWASVLDERGSDVPRNLHAPSRREGAPDLPREVPGPAGLGSGDDPRPGALHLGVPAPRLRGAAPEAAHGPGDRQAHARLPARAPVRRRGRGPRQAGPHHGPEPSAPGTGSRSGPPRPGRPTWRRTRRASRRPPRKWSPGCSDTAVSRDFSSLPPRRNFPGGGSGATGNPARRTGRPRTSAAVLARRTPCGARRRRQDPSARRTTSTTHDSRWMHDDR